MTCITWIDPNLGELHTCEDCESGSDQLIRDSSGQDQVYKCLSDKEKSKLAYEEYVA